jgi:hypothetical protein
MNFKLAYSLHMADHWGAKDDAIAAAHRYAATAPDDFDFEPRRHRNGYVVRIVDAPHNRFVGFLVEENRT